MIGIWNYTVVLTYMSLASAAFGMTKALGGDITAAVLCLAFSGFCDAFDGRVARKKKDRAEDEIMFGIELDSLCDAVCFGFYPGLICYKLGATDKIGVALIIFYAIAAVARLGYFNVLEYTKTYLEENGKKFYYGLPVTSITVIFPVLYFISIFVPFDFKPMVWELMLLIVGGLFIAKIKVPKPDLHHIILMMLLVASLFLVMKFI